MRSRLAVRTRSRRAAAGRARRAPPPRRAPLGSAASGPAVGWAAAAPSINSRQARAGQVLAQINRLDIGLERAIQAYDTANVKLAGIERDQKRARFELHVAKGNLSRAREALSERLVDRKSTRLKSS